MACPGSANLLLSQPSGMVTTTINGRCVVCGEHGGSHLPGCIAARVGVVPLPKKEKRTFAQVRQAKCDECEHASGDTCTITEAKHPGRASIAHGVVRKELRCPLPEPKWTEVPITCPGCNRPRQIITLQAGVCQWCLLERTEKRRTPLPSRKASSSPTRGFRNRGSSFRETGEPQWVSLQQLAHDVQLLASQVPDDVRVIVGVARSGITPASILASLLHLPMLSIRQTKNDIVEIGNGWRLGGNHHINPNGRALIVDDTVMTGNSLKAIARLVNNRFQNSLTAAVYVNPLAKKKPDLWVHDLGWPHLLEWNLFNSVLSPNMACDFDGILCRDCPPGSDDDGPRYIDFINNAKPLYVPRKVPIPMIVTARLEKYREPTMAWLKRHGIHTYNLVMHPATTLAERRRDDIAAYKAKHYQAWASRHVARPAPIGFIESEDAQARRIGGITGLMAICPATGGVYPHGLQYDVRPEQIKPEPTPRIAIHITGSDPVPEPKSDKLIIAVAGGQPSEEQFEITGPLMREYAGRCGADFVALKGDQCKDWSMANKYRIHPFVKAYQRTLYLDCDVIVKRSAPSIFDHTAGSQFAAWDEYEHVRRNLSGDWIQRESDEFCHSQGLPTAKRTTMVNGGLMLFDKSVADSYTIPQSPIADHWCSDQHCVTVWLQTRGIAPQWLEDRWHHSYVAPWFWDCDKLESAHIIHANGSRPHSYRLELLQRLADGNYDRIDTPGADYVPVRE